MGLCEDQISFQSVFRDQEHCHSPLLPPPGVTGLVPLVGTVKAKVAAPLLSAGV